MTWTTSRSVGRQRVWSYIGADFGPLSKRWQFFLRGDLIPVGVGVPSAPIMTPLRRGFLNFRQSVTGDTATGVIPMPIHTRWRNGVAIGVFDRRRNTAHGELTFEPGSRWCSPRNGRLSSRFAAGSLLEKCIQHVDVVGDVIVSALDIARHVEGGC